MRLLPLSLLLMLLPALACGDDGSPGTDAAPAADATVDAGPGARSVLTRPCTGAGAGQDDCPDGFTCIAFGPRQWCSRVCGDRGEETVDHELCAEGYSGPGSAQCMLIGVGLGDPNAVYCAVACEEEEPGSLCTTGTCDGTCPGDMTCDSEVTGGVPGTMCR